MDKETHDLNQRVMILEMQNSQLLSLVRTTYLVRHVDGWGGEGWRRTGGRSGAGKERERVRQIGDGAGK